MVRIALAWSPKLVVYSFMIDVIAGTTFSRAAASARSGGGLSVAPKML